MVARLWEEFSRVFAIAQVCYFSLQIVHINMTKCEGFIFFWFFFWISYAWYKMRSKRRAWPFLARDWVLQKYHWIYDEIYTCEAKNDFWKKIMNILWGTCSSNLTHFQLIRQKFVYSEQIWYYELYDDAKYDYSKQIWYF
jgi:hypothetical protein